MYLLLGKVGALPPSSRAKATQLFVTTLSTLKEEAPRVYFEFQRDVAYVTECDGYELAQKYVDLILRYLDEDQDGEREYVIESILERKRSRYLVRWQGYGPEFDTWEPYSNLENTSAMAEFEFFQDLS